MLLTFCTELGHMFLPISYLKASTNTHLVRRMPCTLSWPL